jgi:hypothetical protein
MQASTRNLAACAAAVLTLMSAAPSRAERVGAYHIFPTPEYIARTGRAPMVDAATTMEYFGGSVFSKVRVVSVIWGPDVNPVTVAGIPGFSQAIVNSTYVDQMHEYDTFLTGVGGQPGTDQHIQRGTFFGQVQITPKHKSKSLTDADVQAELKYQIKQGVLPKHNVKTLYMVYFPVDVTITLDNLTSCFSSITFAASHEYAEATTDNIPTPGSNPAFPQAWNTSDGFEIADLCGGGGTLTAGAKSYTVTQYFLNSTGRCSTGNYTSP